MRTTGRILSAAAGFLVAASWLGGCGSSSPKGVSANIGRAGGAIAGPSGSSLVIPANALVSETEITMTTLGTVRAPRGSAVVGTPIRITPSTIALEQSVELELAVDLARLPASASIADVVIARSPEGAETWVPLPTRRTSPASVAAVTETFGDFVALAPDAASGGYAAAFGTCTNLMCASPETCSTCAIDCGLCVPAGATAFCGDRVCASGAGETCGSCEYDCGPCIPAIDQVVFDQRYRCSQLDQGNPTPFCADPDGMAQLQFLRRGATATFDVVDVPASGSTMSGTFVGLDFEWTMSSPNGYTETGTWTFSADGSTFGGTSTYTANDATYSGECRTTGAQSPTIPPFPAAIGACTP